MQFFVPSPSESAPLPRKLALRAGLIGLSLTAVFCLATALSCQAQTQSVTSDSELAVGSAPAKPRPAASASRPAVTTKPEWKEISPAQQHALQPLAAVWNPLSEGHKRKWLAISANFEKLPAAEQAKLQERMREWVLLSPAQRNQARLNFAETKQLSPAEKQAKWEAYQALSAEEKEKLANQAVKPRTGAATTIKPVPKQKLVNATIDHSKSPAAKASEPSARTVEPLHKVDRNTLLPPQR